MVAQHYRWDFIGLSTDVKPTSDNPKVTDGSTFYCSDNSKLYVWCKNQWYEKTVSGGGGGYVLPIASSETLGGVKVGDNLSINAETGVLDATDTTYTAGTNVSISEENVISATDTTYSNFVGTDGTTAGTAGLVPAPATTDEDKFLKSDGTWASAGGGGSVTPVQAIGDSTTDVMSQNAVSSTIFADPTLGTQIRIGNTGTIGANCISIGTGASINANSNSSVAIGDSAYCASTANGGTAIGGSAICKTGTCIAIGYHADVELSAGQKGCGAIGAYSKLSGSAKAGTISFERSQNQYGYNGNSKFTLLTGIYDGQGANDAVNLGQLNGRILNGGTTAPTTATVGAVGQLYSCVNSGTGELYICTDDTGGTYTWTKLV